MLNKEPNQAHTSMQLLLDW